MRPAFLLLLASALPSPLERRQTESLSPEAPGSETSLDVSTIDAVVEDATITLLPAGGLETSVPEPTLTQTLTETQSPDVEEDTTSSATDENTISSNTDEGTAYRLLPSCLDPSAAPY